MQLAGLLARRREVLLPRVLELYRASDPSAASLAAREADPFRDPVGATVREALEALYDGLTEGRSPGELAGPIDRIVQLRAVQGVPPSEAVGFVHLLGRAARELLHASEGEERVEATRALVALEAAERGLLLVAFDRYAAARERLFAIRLKSELARVGVLLRRARLAGEEEEPVEAWAGGAP